MTAWLTADHVTIVLAHETLLVPLVVILRALLFWFIIIEITLISSSISLGTSLRLFWITALLSIEPSCLATTFCLNLLSLLCLLCVLLSLLVQSLNVVLRLAYEHKYRKIQFTNLTLINGFYIIFPHFSTIIILPESSNDATSLLHHRLVITCDSFKVFGQRPFGIYVIELWLLRFVQWPWKSFFKTQ